MRHYKRRAITVLFHAGFSFRRWAVLQVAEPDGGEHRARLPPARTGGGSDRAGDRSGTGLERLRAVRRHAGRDHGQLKTTSCCSSFGSDCSARSRTTTVIEQIESMGMAVGARRCSRRCSGRAASLSLRPFDRVTRRAVKLHLCGSMRAKDQHIRQALIDLVWRQGGGGRLKKAPGPVFGISSHRWAAVSCGGHGGDHRAAAKAKCSVSEGQRLFQRRRAGASSTATGRRWRSGAVKRPRSS